VRFADWLASLVAWRRLRRGECALELPYDLVTSEEFDGLLLALRARLLLQADVANEASSS
jgi:hypothetical protein